MTGRKLAALIFGGLGFLIGAVLVIGAIGVLGVDRDEDDFYGSDPHRFERPSHALRSENFDILTDAPAWVIDVFADPVDVRVRGAAADGGELFIGIARTDEVDRYLTGVAHDVVTDVETDGSTIRQVTYEPRAGTIAPAPPGTRGFWEISSQGPGTQTLDWSLQSGNWTIVVMNGDGSADIDAALSFGAKVSNLITVTWFVLGFGLFSMVVGGYLVYRGFPPRREPSGPGGPTEQPGDQARIDNSGPGTTPETPTPASAGSDRRETVDLREPSQPAEPLPVPDPRTTTS